MNDSSDLELVNLQEGTNNAPALRLAAKGGDAGKRRIVFLTPACAEPAEFEKVLEVLKGKLDEMARAARAIFGRYEAEKKCRDGKQPETIEEIWWVLGECGRFEEMQAIFNSLEVERRQAVAEFVFTKLNIFKGSAAGFAEHFNRERCILE